MRLNCIHQSDHLDARIDCNKEKNGQHQSLTKETKHSLIELQHM